jgi:hypothetical protein
MRGTTGGTADSAADRVGDLDQKARRRPAAGEVAEADHLDELARKGRGVTLIKGVGAGRPSRIVEPDRQPGVSQEECIP